MTNTYTRTVQTIGLLGTVVAMSLQAQTPQLPSRSHRPSSRIICDEPKWDFGEVEDKSVIKHTFVLKNAGKAPLKVGRIHPGCGCAVVKMDHKTASPGTSVRLTVELTLRGRRGPMHKTIRIESNDPLTPRFPLHVNGTVYTMAHMEPSLAVFHSVHAERSTEKEVRLISRKPGVNIARARTDSPYLTTTLRKDPDGRCVRLVVSTIPPLPQEPFTGDVTVETDDPELGPLRLLASVSVLREVTVVPRRITLARTTEAHVEQAIFILPG
ncbi:MAG: DUF1573 domain-containing protein, partial [Lentisphaerae bacterium]|nr:DUF1573 domain-containing protein [Lentisphaerota bacterium]